VAGRQRAGSSGQLRTPDLQYANRHGRFVQDSNDGHLLGGEVGRRLLIIQLIDFVL
jgi:hypothetical protein